ncbi:MULTISPECIES: hypothetical protein [unclassified Bradyrhizobium]|uniref:hypothetical protein n=1 Tax=unclassified Bradyrhizobium TaxID=2631580 RepID=UPI0028E30268|nr:MULTISPECIES: hypothetical protein [unclassified Bradyrhizobium]
MESKARSAEDQSCQSLRVIAPDAILSMLNCAETRSISLLKRFLSKFKSNIENENDDKTRSLFARLQKFAAWGEDVENSYGKGALLELSHPDIQYSLQLGIITQREVSAPCNAS